MALNLYALLYAENNSLPEVHGVERSFSPLERIDIEYQDHQIEDIRPLAKASALKLGYVSRRMAI